MPAEHAPGLAIIAAALFFYLVFPAAGGLAVRAWWRRFRAGMIKAAAFPMLSFRRLYGPDGPAAGTEQSFRFLGRLEALEGRDTLWLRGGELTVRVAMTGERVIFLPSEDSADFLSVQGWQRLSALPEGTKVFVAGKLHVGQTGGIFRSGRREPLLILFYEGAESSLLRRAVASGRQRNEYWNQFTPISLAMGCLVLLFIGTVFLRAPELQTLAPLAFAASGIPVVPFLPPGVFFFFLYRGFWRKARALRAERDLLSLPRESNPDAPAGLPGLAARRAFHGELTAVGLFLVGFLLNGFLTLRLFAMLIRPG